MTVKSSRTLVAGGVAIAISLLGMSGAVAEEIRVGFIAPITGPFAQAGKDMVNGWEMYADEVKNDFAGATTKFILEDDQAKPPVGVLKAEKLIRQDKVHMLIGGVLASTGYALGWNVESVQPGARRHGWWVTGAARWVVVNTTRLTRE